MGIVRFVHHIQFACKNLWNAYDQLTRGFGYQLFCVSNHGSNLDVVLKNGHSLLMLSETGSPVMKSLSNPYVYTITNRLANRNCPFDIAFEVSDVNEVCGRVKRLDCSSRILLEPVTHIDYHGKVTMAVIRSCLGDLLHTVIDSSQYHGRFMPGYIAPEFGLSPTLKRRLMERPVTFCQAVPYRYHLDHVALACNTNESNRITQWYTDIFDMQNIPTNPLDQDAKGFVLRYGGTGMRLRAVDYSIDKSTSEGDHTCKFVIVEPLEKSAPNQVTRFLTSNGGPGIQHIGLNVSDIFTAVQACRSGGAQFLNPPETYYDELIRTVPLSSSTIELDTLRRSGVLLDTEVLKNDRLSNSQAIAYLLQIFSAPLFEKDGFFMELVERRAGASGFGVANITALWRAVESASTSPNSSMAQRSVS